MFATAQSKSSTSDDREEWMKHRGGDAPKTTIDNRMSFPVLRPAPQHVHVHEHMRARGCRRATLPPRRFHLSHLFASRKRTAKHAAPRPVLDLALWARAHIVVVHWCRIMKDFGYQGVVRPSLVDRSFCSDPRWFHKGGARSSQLHRKFAGDIRDLVTAHPLCAAITTFRPPRNSGSPPSTLCSWVQR